MTILSMVMAAAYVAAATLHWRRAPESLSAMVYVLPPGGWRWLWTLWLWAVALTACVPLMDVMPDEWRSLAFAVLTLLAFVGVFPLFDDAHRRQHCVMAVAAGVFSQLCVAMLCAWWLLAWLVYVPLLLIMALPDVRWCETVAKAVEHKGVLIAEAVCALTVYGAVIAQSIAAS